MFCYGTIIRHKLSANHFGLYEEIPWQDPFTCTYQHVLTCTSFQQIHKHNLYGSKYGWVLHTPDSRVWWNRTYPSLSCSPKQVNQAAEYSISIDHFYISKDTKSTISGLVSTDEVRVMHDGCPHFITFVMGDIGLIRIQAHIARP